MAGTSWEIVKEEAVALVENLQAELADAERVRDIAIARSAEQGVVMVSTSFPIRRGPSATLTVISQREAAEIVLREHGKPLHVHDIIRLAKEQQGVTMQKTSIVSTLMKLSKAEETFAHTGRGTFGLVAWGSAVNPTASSAAPVPKPAGTRAIPTRRSTTRVRSAPPAPRPVDSGLSFPDLKRAIEEGSP